MDGRVKTLHPKIHGAILGRPDLPEDQAAIQKHGIVPFELVVVNLYPFEQTIAAQRAHGGDRFSSEAIAEAVEQIDIGGPSMIRSAAKNHKYLGVVTSSNQFARVLAELKAGGLSSEFRRELAGAAFEMTARYDRAISNYFVEVHSGCESEVAAPFPTQLTLTFQREESLRYGENPHQNAAFYTANPPVPATLATAQKRHGKERRNKALVR